MLTRTRIQSDKDNSRMTRAVTQRDKNKLLASFRRPNYAPPINLGLRNPLLLTEIFQHVNFFCCCKICVNFLVTQSTKHAKYDLNCCMRII